MKSKPTPFIQRLLLAMFLVMAWTCSWAQKVTLTDEQGNKLTYTISEADGVASLTSVSYGISSAGACQITIADEVTYNSVSYPVTSIADQACYYDTYLGKVTIGKNVRDIGNTAFYCCSNMTSITMGGSVENIGNTAFYYCSKLLEIDLTGVKSIGNHAFQSFTGTSISLPDIETMGEGVFYNSSNLQSVHLSDKLAKISYQAFYSCSSLTTITGGENVTEIGSSAFANNSALTSFDFHDKVTVVGNYAFSECKLLSSISGISAITTLGENVFEDCYALAGELEFPALTSLGESAFNYCRNLKGVTLGDGLTTLKVWTFYCCYGLEYVRMPAGLTTVEDSPFYYGNTSYNLKRIYFPGTSMPEFAGSLGANVPTTTLLFVDTDLKESYKSKFNYRVLDYGTSYNYTATLTKTETETVTLRQSITDAGLDPANLMELTIVGPVNGTDIDYLHSAFPSLTKLDMSQASIVAGGDSYHQWKVASDGTATKNTSYAYNTENDVVGNYMFYNMPLLEKVVLPQGVTQVGSYAFDKCPRLAEIDPFPAAVTQIGAYAFRGCSALQSITLPETLESIGAYAFNGCSALQSITLPETLESLGTNAFNGCSALQSISIPGSLESIPSSAFSGCSALSSVKLNDGLVNIGPYAFRQSGIESISMPGTLTKIETQAFNDCKSLVSIEFTELTESRLTTIEYSAFSGCNKLQSLTLPKGLTSIGNNAFSGCSALESLTLPSTLTTVDASAFSSCTKLKKVTLPGSMGKVPSSMFSSCTSLETVVLEEGITTLGSSCFYNCSKLVNINLDVPGLTKIENSVFRECSSLTAVTLKDNITSLGTSVFLNCSGLQTAVLPQGITSIPSSTFYGCSALRGVTISDGVTSIGKEAFSSCSSLENLPLPNSVTTIDDAAFANCTKLLVSELPCSLKYLGASAFSSCKAITISKLPATLTSLGTSAFNSSSITSMDMSETSLTSLPQSIFQSTTSLQTVILPPALQTIGNYAFQYCSSLSSIDLPETVVLIGYQAFDACTALQTINFPANLELIDQYAFRNTGLTEVTLPENLTTLGSYAFLNSKSLKSACLNKKIDYTRSFNYFSGCSALETLRIYAGSVPKTSGSDMGFRTTCVLEVPMGTESLYQAADVWKEFKEIKGFLTGDKLAAGDYAVLKDMYESLNGTEWTKQWDLTTDDRYPGKWYGVTIEDDHIVSINIAGNGHSGTIPASVFSLPKLTYLNLSNGQIDMRLEGLLENTVEGSVLQELYLNLNRLKGDVSALVAKLPALTKVNLSNNMLTEVSEPLTSENLTSLDLSRQFVMSNAFVLDEDVMPVDTMDLGLETNLVNINTLQRYSTSSRNYSGLYPFLRRISIANGYFTDGGLALMLSDTDVTGQYIVEPYTSVELKLDNNTMYYFNLSSSSYQPKPIYIRYIEGDINVDRLIDVADLALLVNYFIKGSKPSGVLFNYGAADGEKNGTLDVRDIVINVNRILEAETPEEARTMRMYAASMERTCDIALDVDADGRMNALTEMDDVTALQVDLQGCLAENVRLASGLKGFAMAKRVKDDGTLRVVVYSASGKTLKPGTTALLQGLSADVHIVDATVTNTQAIRLNVGLNGEATGIEDMDAEDGIGADIYDLSGRRTRNTQKGVYIVNGEKVVK